MLTFILNGIISARVTFHKFKAKLDSKNSKILIEDSVKNDTMSIDLKYLSNIEKSEDNKKLQLYLDNEEKILFEI